MDAKHAIMQKALRSMEVRIRVQTKNSKGETRISYLDPGEKMRVNYKLNDQPAHKDVVVIQWVVGREDPEVLP